MDMKTMKQWTQKQPPDVLYKKTVLKNFAIFTGKTPVLESLFAKVAELQTCKFIEKRLRPRCFPVNITKFLRTSILKNICERLHFCTEIKTTLNRMLLAMIVK